MVKKLAVLILCLAGCDIQVAPQELDWPVPQRVAPVVKKKIVVVINRGKCPPCDAQKELLSRMKLNGELNNVDVSYVYPSSDYPARVTPTMYVCHGQTCFPPREGMQGRGEVLELLK